MALSPIPEILEDLRAGKIVILVDDENRENEGDFVCAAEKVTPQIINFMTRVGGGYLCIAMAGEDCERLDLAPQVATNTSVRCTPFTVSVDGHPRHGVGTGISAFDRAKTIQLLINPRSTPDDFVRPGHINPLRARDGGVLVRTGQTEGTVDLMRLAGMNPAGALIEIVREDGEMARMPDLERIAEKYDMKICSVEQIIAYRLEREALVQRMEPARGTPIDTPHGRFTLFAYQSTIDPLPHLALTVGGVGELDDEGHVRQFAEPVLVRMHRRDLLGDIFDEATNPSGAQLRASLRMIQQAKRGAVVYLRPEGFGDDFRARLQRIRRPLREDVNTPDLTRLDGVGGAAQPMDYREYDIGGQILRDLGLSRLRLLTNHPKSLPGLHGFGLEAVEQVPIALANESAAEQPR
ncbi:MAG TPA: 3,4-dihydroxy-2-butanone-4-phosphate synthase [Phycisphaerales bacterium]|nr:3,4-dihydroxy-2-butanone-4-phosphate synthase [Phycisphaerales bacterium]